jgi:predicted MPP superfamily phosphohydrolase
MLSSTMSGRFEVSTLELCIPGLAAEFDGYSIVQLSDFHYGACTPGSVIKEALALTNSLEPDLVVLTGDYVQHSATGLLHILGTKINPRLFRWSDYRRAVRNLVRELAQLLEVIDPPDGIVGVFGNHDYNEGLGTIKRQLPKRIQWLVNQSTEISKGENSILLSGIDDYRYGNPKVASTIKSIPDNQHQFKLLLSHNPDSFLLRDAADLEYYDLTICGHTHGGQLCLPGRIPLITRTNQREHYSGISRFRDKLVYVNRGLGCGGLPFRLFCPPEIVSLKLKSQSL